MKKKRVKRPGSRRADPDPASINSLYLNDAFGITINHKMNKPTKLFPLSVSHSKPKIQTLSLYEPSLNLISPFLKIKTVLQPKTLKNKTHKHECKPKNKPLLRHILQIPVSEHSKTHRKTHDFPVSDKLHSVSKSAYTSDLKF